MTVGSIRTEMDADSARRLTERIRYCAVGVRGGMEKLQALGAEAQAGSAHLALGYKPWTASLADVLGDEPLRLAREDRREVVAWLAGEGMSTRAIAPIVGVKQPQVVKDIAATRQVIPEESRHPSDADLLAGSDWTPEPPAEAGATADDAVRTEPQDESSALLAPRPAVTGLDGKAYTRPAPAPQRRKALTDAARDAGWELRKATERLSRITEDDRFVSNEEQVATLLRGHLSHAIEVCQDLLDRFPATNEEN